MRRNSSITYRSTCPLSTAASLFLFKFVFPSTNFAQCKIDYYVRHCVIMYTEVDVHAISRQSRDETYSFNQCFNLAKLLRYTVFVSKRSLIRRYEANFCIYYLIHFIDLCLRYIWLFGQRSRAITKTNIDLRDKIIPGYFIVMRYWFAYG